MLNTDHRQWDNWWWYWCWYNSSRKYVSVSYNNSLWSYGNQWKFYCNIKCWLCSSLKFNTRSSFSRLLLRIHLVWYVYKFISEVKLIQYFHILFQHWTLRAYKYIHIYLFIQETPNNVQRNSLVFAISPIIVGLLIYCHTLDNYGNVLSIILT